MKKFNYYMMQDVEASVKHLLKHSQITFKFISPKGKRILKQMWGGLCTWVMVCSRIK